MELLKKLERTLPEAEGLLMELLEGGFVFDTTIEGEKIGVRRVKDVYADEDGVVRTEFFLFPLNGRKDKLKKGAFALIESSVTDEGGRHVFANPHFCRSRKGAMTDVYYAVAASTGGKQIAANGGNTYLAHDILVVTPERDRVALDTFDFDANKLFMLGLYGGDYKIEIREK